MSQSYTYRKMTVEDVQAVHAIEEEAFIIPWTQEAFEYEMLHNPNAYYVLAIDDEQNVCGYCGMWIVLDESHITNVAVTGAVRGNGVGEGLMREAIRVAKEHGVTVMTLEVRVTNIVAQNLYRKLGFQNGGLRKKYYTDNQEDALVMWVNL